MHLFHSPTTRRAAGAVAVVLIFVAAVAIAVDGRRLGDEWIHYAQVQLFAAGRFEVGQEQSIIPGYHAIVAAVFWLFQSESLALARGVTVAFGAIAAFGFASIRRALVRGDDPWLATLQFLFFPILFPFWFLVYTDVPSLALVLWCFRCALDGRHLLAGALGIAALLVRQTNVVWSIFIALLQIAELWRAGGSPRERLRASVALWPHAAAPAMFIVYLLWHGTVALSQAAAVTHPVSLHSGNLFFLLFLTAFFFLPLLPFWLTRYVKAARAQPALLGIPLLLGILYATTFWVDNPYNFYAPAYFLRNRILVYVVHHRWAFVALGVVAVFAGCAVSQVRWQRPDFVLLLPVSALFVSASWLIEERYYLIPFALLLALRRLENRRAEHLMLAFWIPIALGFFYGMQSFKFFL